MYNEEDILRRKLPMYAQPFQPPPMEMPMMPQQDQSQSMQGGIESMGAFGAALKDRFRKPKMGLPDMGTVGKAFG